MFDKINSKTSIGTRLALVSGLFVASTAIGASLLIGNAKSQIDFSKKEEAGADYLTGVWSAVRGAGAVDQQGAEAFNASAAASAFAAAQTDAERISTGLALITAVADGSNLTLDPDLDSFYAMDAATVKIPAILAAALEVEQVAESSSANRDILLVVATERLEKAAAAAAASMQSAIANNASGETRQALTQPASAITDAAAKFIAAARAAAPGVAIDPARTTFTSTVDTTWRSTNEELSRLLEARIAGKQSALTMQLALIALCLAIAGALAFLVSTGLVRRFKTITETMDRLRAGDYQVAVPFTSDGHETGKIAQTLEVLRDGIAQRVEEDARRMEDAEVGAGGYMKAMSRSQAVIEFKPDGTIVSANENFLKAMGYAESEIVGQHHSMFAPPGLATSPEYRTFWDRLNRGEFLADKFLRLGKGGREVWIQASYNPIADRAGKIVKVVKFATDITEQEKRAREAVFKSSAFATSAAAMMMIDRDFKVTYVNESTLKLLRGHAESFRKIWPTFNPDAIVGTCIDLFHKNPQHQRQMLSDPSRLPYRTDITVGDLKIELNVSAVFDAQRNYVGNVLEWADVTHARLNAGVIGAIDKSRAIIEFSLDGKIINANANFCQAMGYGLDEIVGKHHSIFVDPVHRASAEYRAFWERLGRGEFDAGKYKRVAKGGREIWIDASYNPILDVNGKAFKVVKIASDVTETELAVQRAEAERAQRAEEQALVVRGLAQGLSQLAAGNLVVRIEETFPGEYETLRADFNSAMSGLQEAMGTIVGSAGSIRSGAGEISQAADDLSRRTEQQAASLEETAAALDEITATVRKSSESAKQANTVVTGARADAEASGQVVSGTVTAMAEIEKSAKQIVQIIGVIDEIAFQTNLLALNAGVEAARAGEAGRGFAVVASEVRALAQRSSEAAKEIKALISASSQQVEAGVELVGEAGKALQNIIGKVTDIAGLMGEITASAMEQSTALAEINAAINGMDQTTQQNAAMVEQSTAASHSLTKEAEELMGLVGRFKIGGGGGAQRGKGSGQPIMQQKHRVAQFATHGNAAVKGDDGWSEF